LINKVIIGAGVMGCTVIGALTGKYVNLTTPITAKIGETSVALQADILDKIMPQLLPLLLTLGIYMLVKKGNSPIKVMLYIVGAGIIGSLVGVF
jgi:mannose PTS system EIID component